MVNEIIRHASRFIVSNALNARQEALFRVAVASWREKLGTVDPAQLPFVHLPLLVHAAAGGDMAMGKQVAVACATLFLGLDIFDDVADGDLPSLWQGYSDDEVALAGATLIWSLPQLVIGHLPVSPEQKADMLLATARELLKMSAGQQVDLALTGGDVADPDEVVASVEGKTGAELALFAYLGARSAGVEEEIAGRFSAFGRAYGTAGQIASDLYDLFVAPQSRDLVAGTRTLPIAYFLRDASEQKKALFLEQLAAGDPDHVRRTILDSGAVRRVALRIELYRQRALKELSATGIVSPAMTELAEMTAAVSARPRKTGNISEQA